MADMLKRIRKWIDGEDAEQPLEKMATDPKPGSPSMRFIVRIVDAIKADLISGGSYIPTEPRGAAHISDERRTEKDTSTSPSRNSFQT